MLCLKNSYHTLILVIGISALFLNGCAYKQWQDPLGEKEEKSVRALLEAELSSRNNCGCCIDAEINATWNSRINDGGFNGYLQVMLPSSIKLVAINPLGQPLYAFTSDGNNFQSINVAKALYKYGRISTFTEKHDIPNNVFHAEWPQWLTGNMNFTIENIVEIRSDSESRGVWLKIEKDEKSKLPTEFLLFDLTSRQLLERVVYDNFNSEAGRVIYQSWARENNCPLPTDIIIQGLSYGTDIRIELKDIINDEIFTASNFFLKLPPNYLQQYYP